MGMPKCAHIIGRKWFLKCANFGTETYTPHPPHPHTLTGSEVHKVDVGEGLLTAATEPSKHDQVLYTGKEQAAATHTFRNRIYLLVFLATERTVFSLSSTVSHSPPRPDITLSGNIAEEKLYCQEDAYKINLAA